MKQVTIFYSWQSDLKGATNRYFIEEALNVAIKAIRSDDSIKLDAVIVRDTTGLPGSPDIAQAILSRIDQADIFVGDISIVTPEGAKRPIPNPNVLIELGYALKSKGHERIIMVFNTAYGQVEQLPFDLRPRRVTTYTMPAEAEERAAEKKNLAKTLEHAIRAVLPMLELESLPDQPVARLVDMVQEALEEGKPQSNALLRKWLDTLLVDLDSNAPSTTSNVTNEAFLESLGKTEYMVSDFARVAEKIAITDDKNAVRTVGEWFEKIVNRYHLLRGGSSFISDDNFDYYKFLGHELFVAFISFLIREKRWDAIIEVLDYEYHIDYNMNYKQDMVGYTHISEFVNKLSEISRTENLYNWAKHVKILSKRHENSDLGMICPLDLFVDADFFLFLRAEVTRQNLGYSGEWIPWSAPELRDRIPRYLLEAKKIKNIQTFLHLFGAKDVASLREKITTALPNIPRLFNHRVGVLRNFDPNSIGSE